MVTVALTGGTGLVGSRLLPMLLQRGHALRVLVRPLPGRSLEEVAGVRWIHGRLDEPEAVDLLVRDADVILHAAYVDPEPAPVAGRSPEEHWAQTNLMGSLRLLQRTAGLGCRQLVYVSSLAVYGRDPAQDPLGPGRVRDEDFPLWPREFYGSMRAAVEKLVITAASAYGLNTSVFRLGNVLGLRRPWTASPLAGTVAEALAHGEIRTQTGSYVIAVDDVAAILADSIGDASLQGRVFNVFDRWLDQAEAAPLLRPLLGRDVAVVCAPAREPSPPIRGDRIRGRYTGFRTDAAVGTLLAQLVAAQQRNDA